MMTISSPAGRRLARARASELAALDHWAKYPSKHNWHVWKQTESQVKDAGIAIAEELMAHGFHEMDGED
ncbi:hypothetical protein NFI08_16385 [Halomonas sp. EF61]|uniref:hypothetical protein n=1 Tax=Halomonas sp. EF61 TaxID=2950869 RepID=UPI0032E04A86